MKLTIANEIVKAVTNNCQLADKTYIVDNYDLLESEIKKAVKTKQDWEKGATIYTFSDRSRLEQSEFFIQTLN